MRYIEIINEDYMQWNTNRWVHYSNEPYLKINPKPTHQDPAGIYLFPEKFEPCSYWVNKKYKFIVELKDVNILDVSKMSPEDVEKFIVHMEGNVAAYHGLNKEYPIKNNKEYFDRAWAQIIPSYYSRPGAFNKKIREFGYDALFDDTGAILSNEIQLVVFDPRKVKIINIIERK